MREHSTLLTEVPVESFKKRDVLDAVIEHNRSSIGDRWGSEEVLFDGVLGVPTLFLKIYSRLKPYPLTTGEAMFALQLMSFRLTSSTKPSPSYKTLAGRMGISEKMARRYAKQLHDKAYVIRIARSSETNEYDLDGLLHAIRRAAYKEKGLGQLKESAHNGVQKGIR